LIPGEGSEPIGGKFEETPNLGRFTGALVSLFLCMKKAHMVLLRKGIKI